MCLRPRAPLKASSLQHCEAVRPALSPGFVSRPMTSFTHCPKNILYTPALGVGERGDEESRIEGVVEIASEWKARKREQIGIVPKVKRKT